MKPILFNTDMVKAILDGRKTMTRRVCKDIIGYNFEYGLDKEPYIGNYKVFKKTESGKWGWVTLENQWLYDLQIDVDDRKTYMLKPPYQPGDKLYVRETWAKVNGIYIYKADEDATPLKWRPSIHMPKEAARIWLEVTDVRVERLNEITEEDAIKEGVRVGIGGMPYFSCQDAFPALWDSTIKNQDLPLYGWDSNCWVWIYEFKRLEVRP